MAIYDGLFPLGMGTSRLPVIGALNERGIESSVELVLQALDAGVQYIDTASSYSAGMAAEVLKRAFQRTVRPYQVTTKVAFDPAVDADETRRRVEAHLAAMGLSYADHFLVWSIMSEAQFHEIMRPGGIYEGARRLRDEGVIGHICFSTHAPPGDIVKILESGAFEGATISYSLLSALQMKPVLDAAQRLDVGLAVMNPLGGGVIPQNEEYFSFAKGAGDAGTVEASLRYLLAQPAIKLVLCGATSLPELKRDLAVFKKDDPERREDRISRVNSGLNDLKGFCTGCRYCEGCPAGIPIHAWMQIYNTRLFHVPKLYNREDQALLHNIQLFRKLRCELFLSLRDGKNPCLRCGQCEKICTQHLSIMDAVEDIYRRADTVCFTEEAKRRRLAELLQGKGYRKVGFYPAGNYTGTVLSMYREYFGEPEFECLLFDSSPSLWGQQRHGATVHGPEEIPDLRPDAVLISNYHFANEIYQDIAHYQEQGIEIIQLHGPQDVPWVF